MPTQTCTPTYDKIRASALYSVNKIEITPNMGLKTDIATVMATNPLYL